MFRPRSLARRFTLWAVVASLVPAAVATPVSAAERSAAVVTTDRGTVRGTADRDGRVFRAVPYAAPPVGALRWRAPQPVAAWAGTRDATVPANRCAQDALALTATPRITTEDCLYLDVFTPPGRGGNLPVMVFLHGGAFANGAGSDFDGAALAARGTVVVTVNYRLGAFGFLGLPALSAEDAGARSGNYGLLDQQAALRWVRANATAFGGDTARVTVFGQSAGAESVCAHLTSPPAAGLFSRAIVQSGPCHLVTTPLSRAEELGGAVTTHTPCAGQADVPACLRALPPDAVLDAVRATPELSALSQAWSPVTGTPVLPESPVAAIAAGRFARVPVMIGTVLDEGTVLAMAVAASLPLNADTYPLLLNGWFGADVPLVEQRYPLAEYGGDHGAAISAIMGDWLVICPDAALRRSLAAATPTYAYEFADRTAPNLYAVTPDFPLGAYHGSDVLYQTRPAGLPLNAAQARLSDRMLSYWARFAARSDPNGPGTPRWDRFTTAHPVVQTLDLGRVAGSTDFETRHHCGFWAELAGS